MKVFVLMALMFMSSSARLSQSSQNLAVTKKEIKKNVPRTFLVWNSLTEQLETLSSFELKNKFFYRASEISADTGFEKILTRAEFLSSSFRDMLERKLLELNQKFTTENAMLVVQKVNNSISLPQFSASTQLIIGTLFPEKLMPKNGKGYPFSELNLEIKTGVLLDIALKEFKSLEFKSESVRGISAFLMADEELREDDKYLFQGLI